MNRSSDKKSSILSNFKIPEKKGIRLSFKGTSRRVQTEISEPEPPPKSKVQFSMTGKHTNKSLKKPGITTTAKQKKAINLKTQPDIGVIKKPTKKQVEKDRKLFPGSMIKSTQLTKLGRLKTEPSEPTQIADIYKKLANISIGKQKLEKQKVQKPKQSEKSDYKIQEIIGKGTFGVVYKAIHIPTKRVVAIKTVLQDKRYKNRQLQILKMLSHPNVLEIQQHFYTTNSGQQYLNVVMDFFDQTIYSLNRRFLLNYNNIPPLLIKIFSYQMFRGLNYLACLNIAHRDIKPHNILVDSANKVVICDFGSAKQLIKGEANIAYICSRCYRAPQLIFGCTQYSPQIDMWSTGCVIVQMINGEPPFIGDSQMDLLINIIRILGTPDKETVLEMNPEYDMRQYKFPSVKGKEWKKILRPKTDPLLVDLLSKVMRYSPTRRLTAYEALCHPYFDEIRDQEQYKEIVAKTSFGDFFNFNKDEMKAHKDFAERLLPPWAKKLVK